MGKITKEIIDKIIEIYNSGIGSTTIAIELCVSNKSVLDVLNKHGLVRVLNKLSEETKNEIKTLYLSGLGCPTISKQLNVKLHIIKKLIKKEGILRNRFHSEEFYSKFWEENGKWCGVWKCDMCKEDIKFSIKEKSTLNRELKKKKTCKQCSLKKQIGEGNPFYGKTHTEETNNQISKSRTGKYCGDEHHMTKPEYKEFFSILTKERWDSGIMEDVRIKMSKLMKQRIANGELHSYNRSKAEDVIIESLTNIGIIAIPNYKINSKIFDIYIPIYNLLIEYNGDYWHCNPEKYDSDYYNHKKNKTAKELWEYDYKKLKLAKENGYNCEVIWESDYNKNKNIVLETIQKYETK